MAQVNVFTMGWGVRADSGIASVQDLMDKAKAERGKPRLLDRTLGLFGEFLVVLQSFVPPQLIF